MVEIEGADNAIITASGLAAISTPMLAFLNAGDHVLVPDSLYSSGRHFVEKELPRLGIEVQFYDPTIGADIEKLIKKKIELEAIEYDDDRPKERINDGRRAWREGADSNDPRSAGSAHRREAREPREPREGREPRDYRGFRPATVSRDPFFAKPYEPSVSDAAPAWEAAAKVPARSGISANIKPKRKVAALFKAVPATEPTSQS